MQLETALSSRRSYTLELLPAFEQQLGPYSVRFHVVIANFWCRLGRSPRPLGVFPFQGDSSVFSLPPNYPHMYIVGYRRVIERHSFDCARSETPALPQRKVPPPSRAQAELAIQGVHLLMFLPFNSKETRHLILEV